MSEDLDQRISRLETAVAALTERIDRPTDGQRTDSAPPAGDGPDLWVLDGLAERLPQHPSLVLAGSIELDTGPIRWQYGRTTEAVLDRPWEELAPALDALGNPTRLHLLRLILDGVRSTGELAAREELGTTGQLHHHLRTLISAGWLHSPRRGHYEVVSTRVVPLLIILLAAESS